MKEKSTIVTRMTAMIMACMMVLMMAAGSITAYADSTIQTTTLKITGIETGSTDVYAYAIVLAATDADGNTYWKYNSSGSVETYLNDGELSLNELYAIYTTLNTSTDIDENGVDHAHDGQGASVVDKIVYTLTEQTDGSFTCEGVLPGLYIITALSDTATYNPTVVAVNYSYNSSGVGEIASVTEAAVKSSDNPTIDKTADSQTYTDSNIGDEVQFTISVWVPSYGDSWKTDNLHFLITDTLSSGLTLNTDSIKINGTAYSSLTNYNTSTALSTTSQSFTLNLYGRDVYRYAGNNVTITYTATINSNAGVNFDKETNKATLQYSTAANSTDLSEGTTDITYHYTFGIDTTVNGTSSTVTNEITKYGVTSTNTGTETVALGGALFQLTNSDGNVLMFNASGQYAGITADAYEALGADAKAAYGTVYNYVTSSSTGALSITGIDAGTYTLKELQAPEGYSLDTTSYTVVITPTYTTEGELASYTVKISDASDSSITFTNKIDTNTGAVTITDTSSDADTFAINNTKISTLPSTGSFGVISLTLVAIVMMAGFGTAFMMLKKKSR